jgi:hypothetical protein
MKHLLIFLVSLCCLAGCNWSRLMEFRAQMSKSREFISWETRSSETALIFKKPLLALDDLETIGLFADRLDDGQAVIRYDRIGGGGGQRVRCDIRLLFDGGRLAGVIFPAALRDGLGKENIMGFFAMIGGRGGSESILPVPKERLVSAGLIGGANGALGPEFTINLQPRDPRNRSIMIKLGEGKVPGSYSNFLLKLR